MDNVLPFLASLCERLRYTPTESEMVDLTKSSMIEMRIFFEAPALGISDEELFDKILVFYKLRAKGEKSKFKLTDPLADSDRKLSKPTAPIRTAPVAAPKPVLKNEVPVAMKTAEPDRRTFNKTIDVMITPGTGSYSITVSNRNTSSVPVLLDFTESEGVKLTADASSKLPQPLHIEAVVEANGRAIIGRVVPASLTAAVVIHYRLLTANRVGGALTEATCTAGAAAAAPAPAPVPVSTPAPATKPAVAAAPVKAVAPQQAAPVESKPKTAAAASTVSSAPSAPQRPKPAQKGPSDDEAQTERKNLGENLDIIIDNDGNHGYTISIDNADAKDYYVILDMSSSINLLVKAKGSPGAVSVDGQVATFVVRAGSMMKVLDMPVDNFDLQMCELRYKASIRKQ